MPAYDLAWKADTPRSSSGVRGANERLLANVSHELRTPMNVVLGMLQLSLAEDISTSARRYLETAKDSAVTLASLLNDILDYSNIISGSVRIASYPFSLRQTVREAISEVAGAARDKGLQVICHVDRDVPDHLFGDAARLRQALVHLLSNAVKFTDRGRLEAAVAVDNRRGDQVTLDFSIADSGVGIASQDQLRIFAPFEQVDNSTTRLHGGAGLGLAIAAELLRRMGGRLSVESQLGEGSRFLAQLSFCVASAANSSPGADRQPGLPRAQRALSVLLAEDTPGNQQVIGSILHKRGHTTILARNGQEAVDLFQHGPDHIDVILMDVQMPVMDGYQATAEIRRLEQSAGKRTPIIALTAHALQGDQQRCLDAGMDAYVSKPIDIERLTDAVESLGYAGPRRVADHGSGVRGQATGPAVDLPAALKRLGGDISLLREFVRVFDEDTPQLLQALHTAASGADAPGVQRAAHSLKGLIANFGAASVVKLTGDLEGMGRDGRLDEVPPLLPELESELARVAAALNDFRTAPDESPVNGKA